MIITLRNICLEPILRDSFYKIIRKIELVLFEGIKHSTFNQKVLFVLAVNFTKVVDIIFTENVLEQPTDLVVEEIEKYGVKIEDVLNNNIFNNIFLNIKL